MKIRESNLWSKLHSAWKVRRDLHLTRIENAVSSSFPDVEGAACVPWREEPVSFWLELKTEEAPRDWLRPMVARKLRLGQAQWLRVRWKMGCRAYLLMQVGSGANARLVLVPGDRARDLLPKGEGLSMMRMTELGWVLPSQKSTAAVLLQFLTGPARR